MSLLYLNRQFEDNNIFDLKKINDSMSEKIKQNQKQKAPLVNQNGSNISSGLNTEKRNFYNKNYYNEEINSGIFNHNGSQSSLSIDLNRFKINPNNFNNNAKYKDNNSRLYNNNNSNINLDENFETFNPRKEQIISINNSNSNFDINNININNISTLNNLNIKNNENIENSTIINNSKNINKNNSNEQKNNAHSLLKNFNPYDLNNFLGSKKATNKKTKKIINLVNNIPPSASNLQMILYNKKLENIKNQKNPDFLFKQFYQKESRRMLVEYIKVINLSKKNSTIKGILSKENINNLVLLKQNNENEEKEKEKEKEKENNSLNNSINNNKDNNKSIDNLILTTNKRIEPFSINETPKSNHNLMESSSKNFFHEQNSFRILNNFLNDMDDESQDKISLLTFLSIPRIMNMVISKEQKYSFVFYCSPTNISCLYGIETYIFKWNECKNYNLAGYFDLINVENCYIDNGNRKIFNIILNNNNNKNDKLLNNDGINESDHYCIEADDEEISLNYAQAINFTSQLVKYRVYVNKMKGKK